MLSALSIGTEIGTEMCAVQRFSQRFVEDFEIAMRLACVLDPTTMRQTERCPVCELRCKSAAQLQEHVQEKHGADLSSEILESFQKVAQEKVALLMRAQQQAVQALQQQVQQAQQAVGAYKCHLCADSFNDEVQRHMHVIHKHHNELRLKRMDSAHTPVTDGSASPLKGGIDGDVVKCPQPLCDFRTQRAENLAIHLQRHAPLDAALNALQRQRAEVIADGTATANPEEDDEDEAMRATTEVALKMAKENEQKPCPCPIATCQRRYHDINALEKHIAKVHRWQLKLSPKKHTNGIISPSKIVKLTKRYTCQFSKCHQRFATKQLCREHVLSHFRAPVPERAEEGSDSGRAEPSSSSEFVGSMDSYVREEQEHVVKDIHEHLARRESHKEHERNSHTSGSMSPVLEQVVPEGFARPLDSVSQKPYMLQSFIMREQSTSAGGTAYAKGNGGVVHEMIAHLPVRTLLTEPVLMTVELVPAPHIDAQQKPCPCPIATCQRRYHDINALEKHIAKVHRWQLKLSPKKHTNGIISPSKIVKLTKRYTCQFSKCHQRFATKQLCREHVLSHFRAPVPERAEEGSDSGRAEPSSSSEFVGSMDSYVREEQEHVVKDIHEHLARRESHKEHERNSHTSGSMSPVLEQVVPEGFARPLDSVSQKPYMLQSFIMREQSTSAGGTAYAKGNGGVVHEMIAHLPVRTLLTEPVLMTVELVPAPHIDAQVMHV
ncbi:hypothetical protein Tcan_15265 [Toxocara canis]|uniref:C2H2-type domain-containing protein n=1 Tax=Toxocara canis TaxID=6265 RepID=A0A0B2VJN7_TOXCA|nr:hypothetical protein Tcan_15265 [Toxocara canis]